MPTSTVTVHPASPAVGAEIRGVNLAQLSDEDFADRKSVV